MKSTLSWLTVGGLLVMLAGAGSAFARQDAPDGNGDDRDSPKQGKEGNAASADDEAQDTDEGPLQPRHRPELSRTELIAKLGKLHAAMKEHLDLKPAQERAIETLFEEHIQSIKESPEQRETQEAGEDDLQRIRELREELVEARKAGDKERAREIRRQMSEKLRERHSMQAAPLGRLIQQLAGELNEDQLATFRTLIKRLDLEAARRPRDNPLGTLMRAVMHPEIGLSPEQRQAIRELMREHVPSMGLGDPDDNRRNEAFAELREKVLAEMTPEQRARVEAKMEELQKQGDRGRAGEQPERRIRVEKKADDEPKTEDSADNDD